MNAGTGPCICGVRHRSPGTWNGCIAMDHFWNRNVRNSRRMLARELADAGLWAHLPSDIRDPEQRTVAAGAYPFWSVHLSGNVIFNMDGENLAEGGVEEFLRTISPELERRGLPLDIDTNPSNVDPDDEASYLIGINGIICVIFTEEEADSAYSWYLAAVRPLMVVNDLLGQAGSAVRMFTLSAGGNDGFALLLNPRIPAAMRASGLFKDRDIPVYPSVNIR